MGRKGLAGSVVFLSPNQLAFLLQLLKQTARLDFISRKRSPCACVCSGHHGRKGGVLYYVRSIGTVSLIRDPQHPSFES